MSKFMDAFDDKVIKIFGDNRKEEALKRGDLSAQENHDSPLFKLVGLLLLLALCLYIFINGVVGGLLSILH